MIAEKAAQSLTLFLQLDDTEILTAFQHTLFTGRLNEAVGHSRIFQIGYGIKEIRLCHIDDITHFGCLGIFLRNFLVRHGAIEITIVMQQVCCHLGTCLAIDRRHQHRLRAQMVEYPTAHTLLVLIFLEAIIHPQTYRQRPAHRTAPEDSIVGGIRQGSLHFRQSQDTRFRLVFVQHFQLIDSRIEDFAFRKILCGRASRKHHTYQRHPKRSERSRIHTLDVIEILPPYDRLNDIY